jgi:hypothetical protein
MADTPVGNGSASWADVALAYIAFARDDPPAFALTHGILAGVLALLAVVVWMLLPRATKVLATQYKLERERAGVPERAKLRPPRRRR